jgi:hypothetical protein
MKKKELLALIHDLQTQVADLQSQIAVLKVQLNSKQDRLVYTPSVWPHATLEACVDGGSHEYPSPWHAITPAPCKKCGKLSQNYVITCSTSGPCDKEACVGCGCKL